MNQIPKSHKPQERRRKALALAGLIALSLTAALGFRSNREARRLTLERPQIHIQGPVTYPVVLRILHLCDLHLHKRNPVSGSMLSLLDRLEYDLVLLGGDLANDEAGRGQAVDLVSRLRAPLGIYAVPGNHDRFRYSIKDTVAKFFSRSTKKPQHVGQQVPLWDFVRDLEGVGVQVLRNESVCLPLPQGPLWLLGVDDEHSGFDDLAATLQGVPDAVCRIVFTHSPDIFPAAARAGIPLVIAGHTHGGQIVLPLIGAPQIKSKLRLGRPAGHFVQDGSQLYISRGAGSTLPFRLSAPPEVSLIDLLISPS